jgi:hypothetical protein
VPRTLFVIHDMLWDSTLQEIDTIIGKVRAYAAAVAALGR